jgi:hypothetical protein
MTVSLRPYQVKLVRTFAVMHHDVCVGEVVRGMVKLGGACVGVFIVDP